MPNRRAGRHGSGRPATAHAPPCPAHASRAIPGTAPSAPAAGAARCSRRRRHRRRGPARAAAPISLSLSAGIIGAARTPVGIPAAARAAIVSSRRSGVAARGSMRRARARSSVVSEIVTIASRSLAISARMSMSRWISARFGDDRHRVAEITQHLEDRAGDAEPPLDRLIGVGVAAERDRPADVVFLAQLGGQQRRRLRLVEDAALEIEPRRQAEIGVARPRIAIDAAMLAAAIGIDRAVEADVRRFVARDDRPRRIDAEDCRPAAAVAASAACPSRHRTATRCSRSKRPLALLTAPRPLRGWRTAGISIG